MSSRQTSAVREEEAYPTALRVKLCLQEALRDGLYVDESRLAPLQALWFWDRAWPKIGNQAQAYLVANQRCGPLVRQWITENEELRSPLYYALTACIEARLRGMEPAVDEADIGRAAGRLGWSEFIDGALRQMQRSIGEVFPGGVVLPGDERFWHICQRFFEALQTGRRPEAYPSTPVIMICSAHFNDPAAIEARRGALLRP